MPTKRSGLAAVVMNERIYCLGGYDGKNFVSTIESFDPRTGEWQVIVPVPPSHGIQKKFEPTTRKAIAAPRMQNQEEPLPSLLRIPTLRISISIPPPALNRFHDEILRCRLQTPNPQALNPKPCPGGACYAVCSQCIRRGGCRREVVHGRRKRRPLDPDCRYVMIPRPSHRKKLSLLVLSALQARCMPLCFLFLLLLLCPAILVGASSFHDSRLGCAARVSRNILVPITCHSSSFVHAYLSLIHF
jgi:hypothetical protein